MAKSSDRSASADLGGQVLAPPAHNERFHFWAGMVLVLVLAAVPRIWAVLHTEVIQRDGVTFIRFARTLLTDPRGAVAQFDQHAGYPALVAGVHALIAPMFAEADGIEAWELSGQLVSLVFAVAGTLGVWAWAGLSLNWRVAWVAAGLFALGRKWAMLGADVMSDATALALWVWSVVLAIRVARSVADGSARGAAGRVVLGGAVVGLLAGLAYWVRPEGLGAALVAVGVWTVSVVGAGRVGLGPRARCGAAAAGACVLAAAVVAGPYMWEIGGVTKKKRITELVPVTLHRPAMPTDPAGSPWQEVWTLAQLSPRGPAKDFSTPLAVLAQTVEAMNPVVFGLAAAWVVLVGIHVSVPRHLRRKFLMFPRGPGAVAIVLTLLIYLPLVTRLHVTAGYLDWRHCMTMAFALVPLAGAGMVALTDFFATLASPLRLKSLSVDRFVWCQWMWVFPVAAMGVGWQSFRPLHEHNSYVISAGQLIRREVEAHPCGFVVTNLPWVLHYAQVPGKVLDSSRVGNAEYVAQLERLRPTHVALSTRWLIEPGAPLWTLLTPPRYELLASFAQREGGDVLRVYRVHGPGPQTRPADVSTVP